MNSVILIIRKLWRTTHFVSNGPGTCVPFFYVFYIMKCLKLSKAKLIFFESWCRVRDLSLSGKLVKPIVDEFIVHWPELAKKYSKCKYLGKIFWSTWGVKCNLHIIKEVNIILCTSLVVFPLVFELKKFRFSQLVFLVVFVVDLSDCLLILLA